MVERTKPTVAWNNKASVYFKKAYEYIKEESYTNAEKVRNGIIKIIDGLPNHPESIHPISSKKNNPGNYRAFEKYSVYLCRRIGGQSCPRHDKSGTEAIEKNAQLQFGLPKETGAGLCIALPSFGGVGSVLFGFLLHMSDT